MDPASWHFIVQITAGKNLYHIAPMTLIRRRHRRLITASHRRDMHVMYPALAKIVTVPEDLAPANSDSELAGPFLSVTDYDRANLGKERLTNLLCTIFPGPGSNVKGGHRQTGSSASSGIFTLYSIEECSG